MANKIYLGKGRKGKFDIINFSICLSDIPKDKITHPDNGKAYLRLCISPMKNSDSWGNTHTVYVDEFKKKEVDDLPL